MIKNNSLSKMDRILNDRITKWILDFSKSELDKDSYHIDELLKTDCPKKSWIDYAWKCYYQAESECSKFDDIRVLWVFYLNTTCNVRPLPKSLNRQLFNTIETPPEIFLTKNLEDDFFADDVLLEELGKQYSMQFYYSEEQDEADGTYWHYLYFIR